MSPIALTRALRRYFDVSMFDARSGHLTIILLHGESVRVTTTLEIGGDVVRIFVGRIVHAASFEDAADVDHIVAIVEAIQRGGASEHFHVTPSGIAYAGHSIRGDDFEYTTADLDVRDLLSLPV